MSDEPPDTYLRVQPADNALSPGAAVRLLERCHGLAVDGPDGLRGLLSSPGPPTIECCLATRGADDGVGFYLGVSHPSLDPGDDAHANLLARFERTCRTALPRRYDVEPVAWAPTEVLGIDGEDEDKDLTTAAVDLQATTSRTRDWQAPLTTYADLVDDEGVGEGRPPLATVADALADSPVPAIYQACLRPFRDWGRDRTTRIQAIEAHQDTWLDQIWNTIAGPPDLDDEALSLPHEDQARIEGLRDRDPAHSFVCSVRAVATSDGDPTVSESVVREVGGAFGACEGAYHRLQPVVTTGSVGDYRDTLRNQRVHDPSYRSLWHRVPGVTPASRGVVADAREAPAFCLLDGARLPDAAHRGVDPTPDDRSRDPHPPTERLARYDTGMTLGQPVDGDGTTTDEAVKLPPTLQALHLAWFGRTGVGKTTALIRALLDNHIATEGLDLVVAPKGDSFATDYLRAHYARVGDLEDVVYLDCSEAIPAIPFFDVRDELDAGVPRATAVEDTVDHYLEILRSAMGAEQFDQAVRAPDVINQLVKAQFDPVHGDDAFSHRDLHDTMRRMAERQSAPAVSDDDLEAMLGTVTENTARTFAEIMQGVANRMETLSADRRLARMFNHVADPDATTTVTDEASGGGDEPEDDDTSADPSPHVDLADLLDEDVVVVLDTGGLRSEARRVLTLVILSNLWTALRRRTQRAGETAPATADDDPGDDGVDPFAELTTTDGGTTTDESDHPLVNVYLEEAATIADTDLLDTLLSRGRSFDVSVTLAMQFPGQVKETAPAAYAELLNDVNTVLSGPVPVDSGLAERFATDDTPPDAVATQLRALARGEWLTALPADFGERAPQPFVLRSAPEPAMARGPAVDDAIDACAARSRRHAGLALADPSTVDAGAGDGDATDATDTDTAASVPHRATALPHTRRFPDHVEYDGDARAVRCCRCDAPYALSIDGLERAIGCCGSLDEVDRDDVPICELNLKLTPAQIRDSAWSVAQLCFLQAVFNAQQLRYSRLEYDLLADSMIRLEEYVGIDREAVDELVDAGLLRDEDDHPHRLYGVTPDGRAAIDERYRSGTDYGHGQGDLDESSQHVLAVEAGRRWLEQAYVGDPDSPVVEAVPYYDLDENRRLDLAGVDDEGAVRVTVEAERINNDVAEAVPADFDKMASCEPDEAIWIVMRNDAGNNVVDALADPPDGEPRVEKTYADSTPPQQFTIDQPGLTDVVTVTRLLRRIDRG